MPRDVIDAGGGDAGRHRRQAIQLRERRHDRLAKRLDEPAGDGRRRFHRHLLSENRAQTHLESVEGARHAHAGVRLDRRGEARVLAQMLGDQVRSRVEIEQRPDRLSSAGSTGVRLCVNSTISACCFFDGVTRIQPLRFAQMHGPRVRACR